MSIEKNGPSIQGGPEKSKEASKKRKMPMDDRNDIGTEQKTLLKQGQLDLGTGNLGDDCDGGNIALGDEADDIPATSKRKKGLKKETATRDSKIDFDDFAGSGITSSKQIKSEVPSFSTEEAYQYANLPSGNTGTLKEESGQRVYHMAAVARDSYSRKGNPRSSLSPSPKFRVHS